ncbi:3-phytase B, partial [Leucoagaricus sp. SymC.cos]
IVATAPAWPIHSGAPHLVVPTKLQKGYHHHHHEGKLDDSDSESDDEDGEFDEDEVEAKHHKHGKKRKFNMLEKWGNLSPWYSIGRGGFGLDSGVEAPETCRVTGLHFLHRHGARYPTEWTRYGGPSKLANKLHSTTQDWTGSGKLAFLNDCRTTRSNPLQVLTPFGRQQLFDLGVTMRIKYGYLLENFTKANTIPVFRTESQDRMLASAMNFALGFFGWPYDDQYQQSITIEANGFNNTLSPYKTCPNANINEKADRGVWYESRWADIYLADARKRLAKDIKGFDLTTENVFTMQQMCAYETVAIGYSRFCELFTEEEWEGFNYA